MSQKKLTHLALFALFALFASGLQSFGLSAIAEPAHRAARKSQPASPSRAAPDITSTIPASKSPISKDDETLPKPFDLPVAPRARMRICGEKWQAIKMSGGAGDQTWRDFAAKCLAESDGAEKSIP